MIYGKASLIHSFRFHEFDCCKELSVYGRSIYMHNGIVKADKGGDKDTFKSLATFF